jgi:hypothetical protein
MGLSWEHNHLKKGFRNPINFSRLPKAAMQTGSKQANFALL